jgi:uncharacterized protein YdaU (DUF1376 family)
MSFAYMPIFTGDYLRDTRHLTPLKHGVYLLALMHCWDSKGPMPLDEQECAGICNCRSADEIESLRYVLGRFFVRMDDGHYNHRMQREVEKSEALSRVRSEAGRAGYEAKAKHLPSKSQAIAKHEPLSPSPSLSLNKKEERKNTSPSAPADVDEQVWNDFKALRKAKRAPITDTAIKGIREQAALANLTLEDALEICCKRGWRGFEAAWVTGPQFGAKQSAEQIAEEAYRMMEKRNAKA